MAEHFSFSEGVVYFQKTRRADDTIRLSLYNRFPIANVALLKLATAPFAGDLSAQLIAARALWLAFWCGAAVLLYLAIARLIGSRAIALSATLLAFSSQTMLDYNDMVGHESSADLFAVLLVFHGMVLFSEAPTRRFPQLLIKTCVALLLGWHVYALLLPFVTFGLGRDVMRRVRAAGHEDGRGARVADVHAVAVAPRWRHGGSVRVDRLWWRPNREGIAGACRPVPRLAWGVRLASGRGAKESGGELRARSGVLVLEEREAAPCAGCRAAF